MRAEDVLIRKEEIPIAMVETGTGTKPHFKLPIHPIFRSERERFDETLARRLFPEVLGPWYEEMEEYVDSLEDAQEREWNRELFLKERPYVVEKHGSQRIGPREVWRDDVGFLENGFTFYFSLERDTAGSIGVHFGDFDGARTYIGPRNVRFSPRKFAEYSCERDVYREVTEKDAEAAKDGVEAYTFLHHNVELYASALFLRDWAIMYENESLKGLYKI